MKFVSGFVVAGVAQAKTAAWRPAAAASSGYQKSGKIYTAKEYRYGQEVIQEHEAREVLAFHAGKEKGHKFQAKKGQKLCDHFEIVWPRTQQERLSKPNDDWIFRCLGHDPVQYVDNMEESEDFDPNYHNQRCSHCKIPLHLEHTHKCNKNPTEKFEGMVFEEGSFKDNKWVTKKVIEKEKNPVQFKKHAEEQVKKAEEKKKVEKKKKQSPQRQTPNQNCACCPAPSKAKTQKAKKGFLGRTILHMRAQKDLNARDIHHLVVEEGIDPNDKDNSGCTALHYIAEKGNHSCIEDMIRYGADINAVDNNGDTPLHYAAKHGKDLCVAALLSIGANVSIKNKDGNTAIDTANAKGHFKCAHVLRKGPSSSSSASPSKKQASTNSSPPRPARASNSSASKTTDHKATGSVAAKAKAFASGNVQGNNQVKLDSWVRIVKSVNAVLKRNRGTGSFDEVNWSNNWMNQTGQVTYDAQEYGWLVQLENEQELVLDASLLQVVSKPTMSQRSASTSKSSGSVAARAQAFSAGKVQQQQASKTTTSSSYKPYNANDVSASGRSNFQKLREQAANRNNQQQDAPKTTTTSSYKPYNPSDVSGATNFQKLRDQAQNRNQHQDAPRASSSSSSYNKSYNPNDVKVPGRSNFQKLREQAQQTAQQKQNPAPIKSWRERDDLPNNSGGPTSGSMKEKIAMQEARLTQERNRKEAERIKTERELEERRQRAREEAERRERARQQEERRRQQAIQERRKMEKEKRETMARQPKCVCGRRMRYHDGVSGARAKDCWTCASCVGQQTRANCSYRCSHCNRDMCERCGKSSVWFRQ